MSWGWYGILSGCACRQFSLRLGFDVAGWGWVGLVFLAVGVVVGWLWLCRLPCDLLVLGGCGFGGFGVLLF